MSMPGPNMPMPGPDTITVPDLLCGHLPGECFGTDAECAYWRGVVLGEYAPPIRWHVTPEGCGGKPMSTAIEWTEETWNPRTSGPGFGVAIHPDELEKPRSWRKPRTVFVNSMSDLFHARVPAEYVARVWQVMATTSRHTYQVLTKRPERMRDWVKRCNVSPAGWITHDGTDPGGAYDGTGVIVGYPEPTYQIQQWGPRGGKRRPGTPPVYGWPLSNVWLGTSIESDRYAYRADALRATPAAVRFISAEPLLGPLPSLDLTGIDWLIAGGESGLASRPMQIDWVRDLRDRCQEAGVAFFFKQWGGRTPKANGRELDGRTWDEYPTAGGAS